MTDTPKCALSAGKQHNENPPSAVVSARLDWVARDGAFMRRIRPLCLACYTDKAEDASEHAGNGEYSRVTILARYSDSLSVRRLPRVAGSPLPFPSEILDREVAPQ